MALISAAMDHEPHARYLEALGSAEKRLDWSHGSKGEYNKNHDPELYRVVVQIGETSQIWSVLTNQNVKL